MLLKMKIFILITICYLLSSIETKCISKRNVNDNLKVKQSEVQPQTSNDPNILKQQYLGNESENKYQSPTTLDDTYKPDVDKKMYTIQKKSELVDNFRKILSEARQKMKDLRMGVGNNEYQTDNSYNNNDGYKVQNTGYNRPQEESSKNYNTYQNNYNINELGDKPQSEYYETQQYKPQKYTENHHKHIPNMYSNKNYGLEGQYNPKNQNIYHPYENSVLGMSEKNSGNSNVNDNKFIKNNVNSKNQQANFGQGNNPQIITQPKNLFTDETQQVNNVNIHQAKEMEFLLHVREEVVKVGKLMQIFKEHQQSKSKEFNPQELKKIEDVLDSATKGKQNSNVLGDALSVDVNKKAEVNLKELEKTIQELDEKLNILIVNRRETDIVMPILQNYQEEIENLKKFLDQLVMTYDKEGKLDKDSMLQNYTDKLKGIVTTFDQVVNGKTIESTTPENVLGKPLSDTDKLDTNLEEKINSLDKNLNEMNIRQGEVDKVPEKLKAHEEEIKKLKTLFQNLNEEYLHTENGAPKEQLRENINRLQVMLNDLGENQDNMLQAVHDKERSFDSDILDSLQKMTQRLNTLIEDKNSVETESKLSDNLTEIINMLDKLSKVADKEEKVEPKSKIEKLEKHLKEIEDESKKTQQKLKLAQLHTEIESLVNKQSKMLEHETTTISQIITKEEKAKMISEIEMMREKIKNINTKPTAKELDEDDVHSELQKLQDEIDKLSPGQIQNKDEVKPKQDFADIFADITPIKPANIALNTVAPMSSAGNAIINPAPIQVQNVFPNPPVPNSLNTAGSYQVQPANTFLNSASPAINSYAQVQPANTFSNSASPAVNSYAQVQPANTFSNSASPAINSYAQIQPANTFSNSASPAVNSYAQVQPANTFSNSVSPAINSYAQVQPANTYSNSLSPAVIPAANSYSPVQPANTYSNPLSFGSYPAENSYSPVQAANTYSNPFNSASAAAVNSYSAAQPADIYSNPLNSAAVNSYSPVEQSNAYSNQLSYAPGANSYAPVQTPNTYPNSLTPNANDAINPYPPAQAATIYSNSGVPIANPSVNSYAPAETAYSQPVKVVYQLPFCMQPLHNHRNVETVSSDDKYSSDDNNPENADSSYQTQDASSFYNSPQETYSNVKEENYQSQYSSNHHQDTKYQKVEPYNYGNKPEKYNQKPAHVPSFSSKLEYPSQEGYNRDTSLKKQPTQSNNQEYSILQPNNYKQKPQEYGHKIDVSSKLEYPSQDGYNRGTSVKKQPTYTNNQEYSILQPNNYKQKPEEYGQKVDVSYNKKEYPLEQREDYKKQYGMHQNSYENKEEYSQKNEGLDHSGKKEYLHVSMNEENNKPSNPPQNYANKAEKYDEPEMEYNKLHIPPPKKEYPEQTYDQQSKSQTYDYNNHADQYTQENIETLKSQISELEDRIKYYASMNHEEHKGEELKELEHELDAYGEHDNYSGHQYEKSRRRRNAEGEKDKNWIKEGKMRVDDLRKQIKKIKNPKQQEKSIIMLEKLEQELSTAEENQKKSQVRLTEESKKDITLGTIQETNQNTEENNTTKTSTTTPPSMSNKVLQSQSITSKQVKTSLNSKSTSSEDSQEIIKIISKNLESEVSREHLHKILISEIEDLRKQLEILDSPTSLLITEEEEEKLLSEITVLRKKISEQKLMKDKIETSTKKTDSKSTISGIPRKEDVSEEEKLLSELSILRNKIINHEKQRKEKQSTTNGNKIEAELKEIKDRLKNIEKNSIIVLDEKSKKEIAVEKENISSDTSKKNLSGLNKVQEDIKNKQTEKKNSDIFEKLDKLKKQLKVIKSKSHNQNTNLPEKELKDEQQESKSGSIDLPPKNQKNTLSSSTEISTTKTTITKPSATNGTTTTVINNIESRLGPDIIPLSVPTVNRFQNTNQFSKQLPEQNPNQSLNQTSNNQNQVNNQNQFPSQTTNQNLLINQDSNQFANQGQNQFFNQDSNQFSGQDLNQYSSQIPIPNANQYPPQTPNQYPNQIPMPNTNQYLPQTPNQYPDQIPMPNANQYLPQTPNQYPDQKPMPNDNQYPSQTPNQYPDQLPMPNANQYPPKTSNQYPNHIPMPNTNQYPPQTPNQYPVIYTNQYMPSSQDTSYLPHNSKTVIYQIPMCPHQPVVPKPIQKDYSTDFKSCTCNKTVQNNNQYGNAEENADEQSANEYDKIDNYQVPSYKPLNYEKEPAPEIIPQEQHPANTGKYQPIQTEYKKEYERQEYNVPLEQNISHKKPSQVPTFSYHSEHPESPTINHQYGSHQEEHNKYMESGPQYPTNTKYISSQYHQDHYEAENKYQNEVKPQEKEKPYHQPYEQEAHQEIHHDKYVEPSNYQEPEHKYYQALEEKEIHHQPYEYGTHQTMYGNKHEKAKPPPVYEPEKEFYVPSVEHYPKVENTKEYQKHHYDRKPQNIKVYVESKPVHSYHESHHEQYAPQHHEYVNYDHQPYEYKHEEPHKTDKHYVDSHDYHPQHYEAHQENYEYTRKKRSIDDSDNLNWLQSATNTLNNMKKELRTLEEDTNADKQLGSSKARSVYDYGEKDMYSYHSKPSKGFKIKSKKFGLLDGLFLKVAKIVIHKIGYLAPYIIEMLFGIDLSGDDEYGVKGYGNSNFLSNFKQYGLIGAIPVIFLKLLSTLNYFVSVLQRNRFLKVFFIPAIIILTVNGGLVFLVWWLFPQDYNQGNNYGYNEISYDKNNYVPQVPQVPQYSQ